MPISEKNCNYIDLTMKFIKHSNVGMSKLLVKKALWFHTSRGKQTDMHVRFRVHDIRIYSDYTSRKYTSVDGTLSILHKKNGPTGAVTL